MSHRDLGCSNGLPNRAQELAEAMEWLLKGVDLRSICWRRDSRWSPRGLIMAALFWAWSDRATLGGRLENILPIARALWPAELRERISYQAFMKRLVCWTDRLRTLLVTALRQRMRIALRADWQVAGWTVFGADGTKLELPQTSSHESRFSPVRVRNGSRRRSSLRDHRQSDSVREKKANSPRLFATLLWHAGTRLPWDWRLGAADSSERGHLIEMIAALPEGSLLTADAGFVGYAFWSAVLGAGHHFLIRVGSNVRLLQRLGVVRESAGTVCLWPEGAARRGLPPLVLRLVVVRGKRHPWYLVTSVRDRKKLSDRDVCRIYARRWGVEVFFRHFKQTFGRHKLRSHSAPHVLCEAEWSLLGLWTMLLYAKHSLHRHRVPLDLLSVAQTLRAYQTCLQRPEEWSSTESSLSKQLARARMDQYARGNKTSRSTRRKKYNAPCGPPDLFPATHHQVAQAKSLTQTSRRRLTA